MTSRFAGQACGIYPRVSTRKQAKKDRSSLKDQEYACRDYANEKGMIVDEECVKADRYTSKVMNRPELNLLLAKMIEHGVPNLIIDRVDRMTRGGVVPAVMFLQQFTRAHILLHVISAGDQVLILDNDPDVKKYVDAAYDAQQANIARTRIVMRGKRSRVRDGYFLRGNKPPFGFVYVPCEWDEQGNVIDKRHDPDERLFTDLGFPTVFAATPYAARKEMLRLYADGLSARKIADQMTAAGVPTPWVLAGRVLPPKVWQPHVVTCLVSESINEGILTNFRATYTTQDPDDKHDEEWVKIEPIPLDKQIIVTPAHGSPDPLLDAATAARLKQRRETPSAFAHPRQTVYAGRALLAGRALCGMPKRDDPTQICGGGMRVRSVKRPSVVHFYYSCTRHDMTPAACAGLSLSALRVDPLAWARTLQALTRMDQDPNADNYLDVLSRRQADLALTDPTTITTLSDLIAIRDDFRNQADTYAVELGRSRTDLAREAIQRQIDRLEPAIADANRRILTAERQAARTAERRQFLADSLHQYHRYLDALYDLKGYIPSHRLLMANILRLVGAEFILRRDEHGHPTVHVLLTITSATAEPWFTGEQEAALEEARRDARRARTAELDASRGLAIEWGEPAAESDRDSEYPSFPPSGYSPRRT